MSKEKSLEEMRNELTAIEESGLWFVTCYSATIDDQPEYFSSLSEPNKEILERNTGAF